MTFYAFGDSITWPTGYPVTADQVWAKAVASRFGQFGTPIVNSALPSNQAKDQTYFPPSVAMQGDDIGLVFLGVNDISIWGADTTKRTAYVDHMRAILVDLSCPVRIAAQAMTKTGAWTDMQPFNGSQSSAAGAKASGSVDGPVAYIAFRNQVDAASNGAASEIRVDGVLKATRVGNGQTVGDTYCSANPNTPYGITRKYGSQVTRLTGLGAGSHVIEVANVTAGKTTLLESIAAAQQTINPHIFVLNIPRRSADPAFRADYNAALATMVSELAADGRNVHLVDIASIITTAHLYSDGLHLNLAGHQAVADLVSNVITMTTAELPSDPPPPDPPVTVPQTDYDLAAGGHLHLTLNTSDEVTALEITGV